MKTNIFIHGTKIDSSLIISNTVSKKENIKKLFNIAGFLEENTAKLIVVDNHHCVMGDSTEKRKLVIQVLSEEIRINHLEVNKTNNQNVYFLPI